MTRRLLIALLLVASVLAASCSGGGGEPELEAISPEPVATPEPSPSSVPEPSSEDEEVAPITVVILSATVGNVADRPDLSPTVSDLLDQPVVAMPDVIGLEIDEARSDLASLGLVPYFIDTFPQFEGPEIVIDSFPFPGDSLRVGQRVLVEMNGPGVATVSLNGEQVSGSLNGEQEAWTSSDSTWFMRLWLDVPLAVGVEGEVRVVGREIGLWVGPDQVRCQSGAPIADASELDHGLRVSFTLDHSADDEVLTIFPTPLGASALEIDCEQDL